MDQKEVSLFEVMDFRELKSEIQKEMINTTSDGSVISLGMNIPGPVKTGSSIHDAFEEGKKCLEAELKKQGAKFVRKAVLEEKAGYAVIYLVTQMTAEELKRAGVFLEETHMLGRLFDVDVMGEGNRILTRESVGGEKRKCLICSGDAKECGRNRAHSVQELNHKVTEIIEHWKASRSDE